MANTTQSTVSISPQFYRLPQLAKRLGVSGSSIWNWCKNGTFPKPIKLSENCTAWEAAAVDKWANERITASKNTEVNYAKE